MNSQLQFVSYKIDKIDVRMTNKMEYLVDISSIPPERCHLSFRVANPGKYLVNGKLCYLCNIGTKIEIKAPSGAENMMTGEFGISGIFSVLEEMDKATEESMIKTNVPAILMPYLRATMTNILSNAGFGTILFPLINMYEYPQKSNVQILDFTIQQ